MNSSDEYRESINESKFPNICDLKYFKRLIWSSIKWVALNEKTFIILSDSKQH